MGYQNRRNKMNVEKYLQGFFPGTKGPTLDAMKYFMEKLETHRKDSILEPKIEKEKKSYSTAWNHPWRKAFYENYLKHYRLINKIIMLIIMNDFVKLQRY